MQCSIEDKKHKDSYIYFCFFFWYVFRLMCSSPRLLVLHFSRTTTRVIQQELYSGDFRMICLLGLLVFYQTAKPSITILQRLINLKLISNMLHCWGPPFNMWNWCIRIGCHQLKKKMTKRKYWICDVCWSSPNLLKKINLLINGFQVV